MEAIVLDLSATLFTPWDSKSILWTQTLHPPLNLHSGEKIMREFSFLGELSIYVWDCAGAVSINPDMPVDYIDNNVYVFWR